MPARPGRALAGGEVVIDAGADREDALRGLQALPGIGPWTLNYIAMRALRDPDAYLPTDLGIRHALERLGQDAEPAAVAPAGRALAPVPGLRHAAPVGVAGRGAAPAGTGPSAARARHDRSDRRIWHTTVPSPIGDLLLVSDGVALRGLWMQDGPTAAACPKPAGCSDDGPFGQVTVQLDQYFAGERTTFDLPLVLDGTPFQQRVWSRPRDIPYGTTISYGELAAGSVGPSASRAVGLANGRNPISVIVPCHRVIGADGSLTGYGGGLERKRLLLGLEAGVAGWAPPGQLRLAAFDDGPGSQAARSQLS